MNSWRCALVLFVGLVLTLSFAVPVEDVPETPYDESASLPYVSIRVVSLAGREPVVEASVVSSADPECVAEALTLRPHAPSMVRLGFLTRAGALPLDRRTGWAHRVLDSVTILDHVLRC